MFSRSTLLHLRIPFSFFLMPVYFFALCISPNLNGGQLLWSFLSIHLFLYPASNGFNSYFDKDEKSIGGLKNPPKVEKGLYYMSLLFDLAAIVIALVKINKEFAIMLFIYGLASKAYSHPMVRLKKRPILGWLTVVFFQGAFTFMMCYVGINAFGFDLMLRSQVIWPAVLSSVMLFATYPMTQVYQHEEDKQRGDITMSIILGIRGTFYFAMGFFTIAAAGFVYYFYNKFGSEFAWLYLIFTSPVVLYFLLWMLRVHHDPINANFTSTMRLNFISALCLNAFFIYTFVETSHILNL